MYKSAYIVYVKKLSGIQIRIHSFWLPEAVNTLTARPSESAMSIVVVYIKD
jgi:hypothetical protein